MFQAGQLVLREFWCRGAFEFAATYMVTRVVGDVVHITALPVEIITSASELTVENAMTYNQDGYERGRPIPGHLTCLLPGVGHVDDE